MNTKINEVLGYLRDPNYNALVAHYKKYPLALYTGAGVSWSSDKRYGLRGWNDFVRKILEADRRTDLATMEEFNHRWLIAGPMNPGRWPSG